MITANLQTHTLTLPHAQSFRLRLSRIALLLFNFKSTYVSIAVDMMAVNYIFNALSLGGPNFIVRAVLTGLSLDRRLDNVGSKAFSVAGKLNIMKSSNTIQPLWYHF